MADIRVVLCDDHAIVRGGLRRILQEEPDIDVVGEAGTAAEAIDLARGRHPGVLVMDLGLPDANGIVATLRVREVSPDTHVLVLTVHDDVGYLRKAFEAGASGYLVKEAADVELVQAVRTVASGRQYVHPTLGAALLTAPGRRTRVGGPGGQLSERELDVLRLVALGLTNGEIAERLYVSVRTVESHRSHIHQKLDVRSRAELVRLARAAGLLDDEGERPSPSA